MQTGGSCVWQESSLIFPCHSSSSSLGESYLLTPSEFAFFPRENECGSSIAVASPAETILLLIATSPTSFQHHGRIREWRVNQSNLAGDRQERRQGGKYYVLGSSIVYSTTIEYAHCNWWVKWNRPNCSEGENAAIKNNKPMGQSLGPKQSARN